MTNRRKGDERIYHARRVGIVFQKSGEWVFTFYGFPDDEISAERVFSLGVMMADAFKNRKFGHDG